MKVEEIVEQADSGVNFAKQVQEGLKKTIIAGKTMGEWKIYFSITVPPDLNPQTCITTLTKLITLYQEAAFLKSRADRTCQHLTQAAKYSFTQEFYKQIEEIKEKNIRIPSKDTLEILAEQKITELRMAEQAAKVELSFWKDIIDNLSTTRKVLEQITINLGIERKMLQTGFVER